MILELSENFATKLNVFVRHYLREFLSDGCGTAEYRTMVMYTLV